MCAVEGPPVEVEGGAFKVAVDCGSDVFGGNARPLEIAVGKTFEGVGYATLDPRQPLAPTPYSLFAGGWHWRLVRQCFFVRNIRHRRVALAACPPVFLRPEYKAPAVPARRDQCHAPSHTCSYSLFAEDGRLVP